MILGKAIVRWSLAVAPFMSAVPLMAEEIGEVSTVFKFLSPDHKIKVDAFDDAEIEGITCYLSRADTGGFKSLVGLSERCRNRLSLFS